MTDSTESSIDSMEESTTSSVESSVESADSSVEIMGTPIEYTRLAFNGYFHYLQGTPDPKIVTSKEELLAFFEGYQISWQGEPFAETLPEDYFENNALVLHFYGADGSNIKREIQDVILQDNTLIVCLKETLLGNIVDLVHANILFCVQIDKTHIEEIEETILTVEFEQIDAKNDKE